MGEVGPGKEEGDRPPGSLPEIDGQKWGGVRRAAEEMIDVLDEETALRTDFVVNLTEKVLVVLEVLAPPTTKLTESGAVLDIQRRFQTEIDTRRDDAQDSVWRLGPDPPSRDRSMDALAGEGVVVIRNIPIR